MMRKKSTARRTGVEGLQQAPVAVGTVVSRRVGVVASTEEVVDDRQEYLQRPARTHHAKGTQRGTGPQEPQDLLQHARRRRTLEVVGVLAHRVPGLVLDPEAEPGGELDRPQDPHRILGEANARVADRPQQAGLEIGQAVDVVVDHALGRIVEESVDREVAPTCVLGRGTEDIVLADQEIVRVAPSRLGLGPEGRGLDQPVAVHDVHQPEAPADDPAVAKQPLDLAWMGLGSDVEVLGLAAEEQIADAAADEIGLVATALQTRQHPQGVLIDVPRGNPGSVYDPVPREGLVLVRCHLFMFEHAIKASNGREGAES